LEYYKLIRVFLNATDLISTIGNDAIESLLGAIENS